MAAVKVFLCAFCLIVAGGRWMPGGSVVSFTQNKNKGYENIIKYARKEIGTREGIIENSGQRVAEYLRYVDIQTRSPWCAAWLSWVFGQAGFAQPRTAWSPALFPASRRISDALPGRVYGIYFPALKRIGHCGLIESIRGDWVVGIEGNTNVSGSRDGDGVYRKWRHKKTIHCMADWSR